MDTVVEMTPVMGGGWREERFVLAEPGEGCQAGSPGGEQGALGRFGRQASTTGSEGDSEPSSPAHPIWGDAPRAQPSERAGKE